MKKIFILIPLFFIMTSCFGGNENKEIVKKTKNIENTIGITEEIKLKKEIKEINVEIIFGNNTNNFIKKLEKNPNILESINCDQLKDNETIGYCYSEKEKLLISLKLNEKENIELERKIQKYKNKNIMKELDYEYRGFLLKLEKDSEFLETIKCEKFSSKKVIAECKKEKNTYLNFISIKK